MTHLLANVRHAIGNTPLVLLNRLGQGLPAQVAVKLESQGPGNSVKDRIALGMLQAAEAQGLLTPATTLIEPTSGNTGIALAMLCAAKGYKLILTMPDSMSLERRALLRAYGAHLVLTPAAQGMKAAIAKAEQLVASTPNALMLQQFANPANPQSHFTTTGPEVWQACQEAGVTLGAFVAGVGTGGTITGVGRYLRQHLPNLPLIAVEPAESPVLQGGQPSPHKIQGIGAGFVPPVLDVSLLSEILSVSSDDALAMSRRLAAEEGLFSGISAGANAVAALQVAARPEMAGKLIVTIQCSYGERYLSSALFQPIVDDVRQMSAEPVVL
jgi:cysteine synthase A